MNEQDSVYCKIFGIVSKTDTCTNCSINELANNGRCKNVSDEWRF